MEYAGAELKRADGCLKQLDRLINGIVSGVPNNMQTPLTVVFSFAG
jgi:hypothetical protein